ncbi:hypothetical protein [Burkholderia guangdongensis]|uniref:hypothetical protein n=1 Tax=Burkholderia guangdongensis TaxID=1792500 RepID=UPI0015CD8695|nr:hypothetical protein [Burkholderia guangdongensis]
MSSTEQQIGQLYMQATMLQAHIDRLTEDLERSEAEKLRLLELAADLALEQRATALACKLIELPVVTTTPK